MFYEEIRRQAEAATRAALPDVTKALWSAFAAGQITEAEAESLSAVIDARTRVQNAPQSGAVAPRAAAVQLGALRSISPARRLQRAPDRSVAIERRRRLAASGPLPPALAARFTTSEAAVMRIVGDECRDKGRCVLPIDAIAARAGVGRTTAQNALRLAQRLGMIEIEERRQTGAKNLPNRVTVVDREWRQWLARGPRGIGFKNSSATETQVSRSEESRPTVPSRRRTAGTNPPRRTASWEAGA